MYKVNNFIGNDDVIVTEKRGNYQIIEYARDLSVSPVGAITEYFSSKMNIRRRQLVCKVGESGITIQRGAMQWTVGNVQAKTGIKGVGDFIGKAFASKATGETAVKPEYTGNGVLVLEPTYRHLILMDVSEWGGKVVLDDGLFLACDSTVNQSVVARSNLSSALAGGEGLFNLCLSGDGIFCIESYCPKEELVEVVLDNDVLKVDGNYAIAWSSSLDFTVERSSRSLVGSAVSGEGLVNVYRGTGKVLMMPVRPKVETPMDMVMH